MPRLTLTHLCLLPLPLSLLSACGDNSGGTTDGSTGPGITSLPVTTGGPDTTPVPTTGELVTTGTTTGGPTMGGTEGATSTMTGQPTTGTDETTSTSTGEVTATTGTQTTEPPCPMGTVECDGKVAKTCDGFGGYSGEETCEAACQDLIGCLPCEPDATVCDGDVSMKCSPDGMTQFVNDTCDAIQGTACNPEVGQCDGLCALSNLQLSYIGCDYYPTITLQHDSYNDGTKIFAAIVANTAAQDAKITITRGAMMVSQLVVPSGSVKEIPLPWIPELTKGLGPSKHTVDGAYRLRSDRPVTVYQYNLLYADASNDASLLLPVNAWTGDYVVASYPHATNNYPGFYAVVAREDGTVVTLSPSGTGGKVQAGGGVAADGTGQVTLDADDVLQVATAVGGDLTGTKIQASAAVQVIAGHKCAKVSADINLCDHLEEAMFPLEALANEYIIVPPLQYPIDQNKEQGQVVRVIASEADTTLTFTPDQGVNTKLAAAGDFVEIVKTTARFKVAGDKKILVAQYMMGQGAMFGEQDPSMLLAVATEQYRKDYLFQAPNSWEANFVDIILKSGTKVTVDGKAIAGFIKIDGTEYSLAHVPLAKDGTGAHTLTASDRVGISVYGIQDYGSYWLAGGLDLDHL